VLFGVPHSTAGHQHVDHGGVGVEVERCKDKPLVQTPHGLLARARQARHQLAEDREVHLSIALSLRDEPRGKLRVPVDLDAFEEVAAEAITNQEKTVDGRLRQAVLHDALDFECVDDHARQIERDRTMTSRLDAPVICIVQQGAELAQAPSELSAWVVGHVPQEGTQPRPRIRDRPERQECE
jgi:hypothetical protein